MAGQLTELLDELDAMDKRATPGPVISSKGVQGTYYMHVDRECEFARFENRICEFPFTYGVGCNRISDLEHLVALRNNWPRISAALRTAHGIIEELESRGLNNIGEHGWLATHGAGN